MTVNLPPLPQQPRDRYGRPVYTVDTAGTVWGQLVTALTSTVPSLLRRLAAEVDTLRLIIK